jgi:hypothetical protein
MFILSRVMIGFAAGVLACEYFPQIARPSALPILAIGVILFLLAAKGLARSKNQ